MCALQWRDIVTKTDGSKALHVQREVVSKKGGGYQLLPHCKTKAGDRYLPLNSYCMDLLHKIRLLNAEEGISVLDPNAFIFQRKYKGTWTYCTVRSFDSRLRKYCREARMKVEKSPHDVRRTCLTVMYDNGTPVKQLQYFAGHETVTQTLDYIRRKADTNIEAFILDDSGLFLEKEGTTEK